MSTPVTSASPIIRPLQSVKIKCSIYPFARSFTRAMTVSGITMASHILLVILFSKVIIINLNSIWLFTLRPRNIADFLLAAWLFLGVYSSWTWQHRPILRARCLL